MRLRNYTDIDSNIVRRMIAFCKPSNVAGFDVEMKNFGRDGVRGRAYPHGCGYRSRGCPLVVVAIQRSNRHLKACKNRGAYLPRPPMTREEAVLKVLAHELRHLWQSKVKKGRRVWGSRGQYSERDADAYALRALRHWRRGEPMP